MQNFGRGPADFTGQPSLDTADFGGKLVVGRDDDSHVQPHMVPYTSMAHLKSLIGVPDAHYESGTYSDMHVAYPQPLQADRAAVLRDSKNICDLRSHLTADEHQQLGDAARSYVLGHSAKVADFEDLLDAHFTPGTIAFFAAADLTVQDGQQYVVTSPTRQPIVLNFGTVTVIGSGQIIVEAQATIVAQQFTYRAS